MLPASNGWPVLEYKDAVRVQVPKVPGCWLTVAPEAADLLSWVVWRFHTTVDRVNPKTTAAWNVRPIAGSNRWSTHATGGAVDINWDEFPMFTTRMTRVQRNRAKKIEDDSQGTLVWGGRRSWVQLGRADEMHYEIRASKRVAAQVGRQLVKQIR